MCPTGLNPISNSADARIRAGVGKAKRGAPHFQARTVGCVRRAVVELCDAHKLPRVRAGSSRLGRPFTMGPRAGFGTILAGVRTPITVSEHLISKTVLFDSMILVHRQVARLAIHIDRDRDEGIQMVAAGFRDHILDIIHRGIGVVCVFDGGKLPGKGVNQTRNARLSRYRAMLDELRQGEAASTMPEGEFKKTEKRYLRQCTMVKEDMILACICELEKCGIAWRRARFEADAELAHLVTDPSTAGHFAAVYSEDLDLVVHGVPWLITTWDVVNDSALM